MMRSDDCDPGRERTAGRCFAVAWAFLLVTAASGVLLRLQGVWPIEWLPYDNLLHTHSHIAFLGWVFNAFVALSLLYWSHGARLRSLVRIFFVLQVANVGMLIWYPIEGYGMVSIAFSTLHTIGSVWFAVVLWRSPDLTPTVRPWVRWALVWMLLSGIGPVVLGPLAALDLRGSPAYPLSIYWYLHCQSNGWFVLFLFGVVAHLLERRGVLLPAFRVYRNLLMSGILLTYAVSALWINPPAWVFVLGGVGAVLQLIALGGLLSTGYRTPGVRALFHAQVRTVRWLVVIALGVLVLKCVLQLFSVAPQLQAMVNHRYMVIAFLHTIFLASVLPALIAIAVSRRWVRTGGWGLAALVVLGLGVAAGQLLLVYPVLAGPLGLPVPVALSVYLLLAAVGKLVGLVGLTRWV